jgi:putative ABC transport system permease protein
MRIVVLLALRSLIRNRRRSAIALATIGFGVAALIIAGGFVNALLVKLREDTIYSRFGHIQIQDPKYAELGLSEPYAHLLPTDRSSLNPIARLPGVRMVTPRLAVSGLISVGETTLAFTGQGIDAGNEVALARGLAMTGGVPLEAEDSDAVILGEGLAANLGVKPGDTVALLVNTANGTFNAMDVKVRGTFASVSKAFDDLALRLPLSAAQRLLRVKGAQQWLVLLDDTSTTGETAQRIRQILPGDRYVVTRWDEDADFYHKTSELFARQFGFVRVVVMIIIVLSILNTMTLNVLERTWEIGVMLALGDSRRQVLALFACEGALLGIVGGIVGAGLGLAVAAAANTIGIPMPAPPGMSHGFDVGIAVSGLLVASAFAIGAFAAVVASLPPSLRASRLAVVDALRASR